MAVTCMVSAFLALAGFTAPESRPRENLLDFEFARRREALAWVKVATQALKQPGDADGVFVAVVRLGSTRSPECVPFLVGHILLDPYPPGAKRREYAREHDYDHEPCVRALIMIGAPAVLPVLDMAAGSDDRNKLTAAARVVSGILGPKHAKDYITRYHSELTDEVAKKRISAILKMFAP